MGHMTGMLGTWHVLLLAPLPGLLCEVRCYCGGLPQTVWHGYLCWNVRTTSMQALVGRARNQ